MKQPDLTQLVASAESGDTDSQLELGIRYRDGRTVRHNPHKALYWLRRAATGRGKPAEFAVLCVGDMYLQGRGMPKDYATALRWLRNRARSGCQMSASMIGDCYFNGWGVPRDVNTALRWYRKGAGRSEWAAFQLGSAYRDGCGVRPNAKQAYQWYRQSALLGFPDGQYELGLCYLNGWGIRKNRRLARHWLRRAAYWNHAEARAALRRVQRRRSTT
jgi:TPR repeat protein